MLFKCIVVSVVALKGKAFPMQVLQLCSSNGGMVSLAKVLQLCWGGGQYFLSRSVIALLLLKEESWQSEYHKVTQLNKSHTRVIGREKS